MTLTNSGSRFSVSTIGAPQVANDFDKFEMNATQKYPLGFKVEAANGDVYRYCCFAGNVNRGCLVSSDLSEYSLVDDDNHFIAPVVTYQMAGEQPGVYPGAIGSRYAIMTLASVAAHCFAGSKITFTDDTGEGYTYDVVDNTATDNPASGVIRFQLAQPLQVAITTDTDASINTCLYNGLIIATTTDACVVGVTCSTIVAATAAYAWIQTKGVVGILQDVNVPTIGGVATLSNITAGAVTLMGGNSTYATYYGKNPIIGYYVDLGDATGASVCKINLE